MSVSIIIPTYNEKTGILKIINSIKKTLDKKTIGEIIIVDDSSPDGTYAHCKKIFFKQKKIRVFNRKKDFGLAKAILFGMKKAKSDTIVVMDADTTHNPSLINTFMSAIKNFDIISGSRFCAGGNMQDKPHYFCSFLFNILLRVILGTQIQDNLGGFFAIRKKTFKSLPHSKIFFGYGDYFFRLLYYAQRQKKNILEIPAIYLERKDGFSKSNFFKLLFKYLKAAIALKVKNIIST